MSELFANLLSRLQPASKAAFKLLMTFFAEAPPLCLAFSGGMDSSFMAWSAELAAPQRHIAVFVSSEFVSDLEKKTARSTAAKFGFRLIETDISLLQNQEITANDISRCYLCKKAIFRTLADRYPGFIICEGSVTDDESDFRPGKKAIAELAIESPLKNAGINKTMIREILAAGEAKDLIREPQSCLATRLETGTRLCRTALHQIEKGEEILRFAGLRNARLRHLKDIARIEVDPRDIHRAVDVIQQYRDSFSRLGFRHICIDADGYQKGSANKAPD
jgi:uncharacterized protein